MKKQSYSPKYELLVISSLDEIPARFVSEDEEREFWATHEFSKALLDSLPEVRGVQLANERRPRMEVCSWDEVPEFKSEDEERAWWEKRVPSDALLDSLPERPILSTRLQTLREFVRLGRSAKH
jgi:hypothetical protein